MAGNISTNNREVGKRIRELREESGLTQDELAEVLSVGPNVIGCYERGEYGPSKKAITLLCRYFGVSSDYILYGETIDVGEVLNNIDHFSDADKMKLMMRLMCYFMKGRGMSQYGRENFAEVKAMLEDLFSGE